MNLGAPELLIVLAGRPLLFGGAKLPKLARSLGQAQNEFKKGCTRASRRATDDAKPAKPADLTEAARGTSRPRRRC